MSSYDKLIKAATKAKPGPPKAKHVDPIIAASFSKDGSLQDMTRSLANRLREPNSIVVFKSLIVLHTMIRNGGVDNVLSHLASDAGSLKMRNVIAGGNWQGYDAPPSLASYAAYLDARIAFYRELKYDVIRSQESARASEGGSNRLRKLTVEKGLLREVSIAQRVCGRVLECSFFLEDFNDEMTITAFRMTLKDLLALYTAINEGMINILEHYFEMSKPDATRALDVYKRFTRHTEKVVAYLGAARKASYALNIAIPNLKHAPVSLAGALQEYLDDENFEQNRREYRANRRAAEGLSPEKGLEPAPPKKEEEKKKLTIKEPTAEEKVKPPKSNQALQDFFDSIESEQTDMFNSPPPPQMAFGGAPGGMGMGGMGGMMPPQMTGMQAGGMMGGGMQLQPQMTGYNPFLNGGAGMQMQSQMTGFAPQQQQQAFLQPQQTAFQSSMLQPQMTGFNPFRQSVMMQPTGFGGASSPFGAQPQQGQQGQQEQQQQQMSQSQSQPLLAQHTAMPASSPQPPAQQAQATGLPPSSSGSNGALSSFNSAFGSTPFSAPSSSSSLSAPSALLPQKTGSRNPFAPPPGSTPPPAPAAQPKGPSLRELATGAWGQGMQNGSGGHYGLGAAGWDGKAPAGQNGAQQQGQQQGQGQQGGLVPQQTGLIGSIASEFAFGRGVGASSPAPVSPAQTSAPAPAPAPAAASSTLPSFSALSLGAPSPAPGTAALAPQPTGYAGSSIKPFQPTSTFGTSLAALNSPAASLSPAPQPLAPNMTGNPFAMANGGGAFAGSQLGGNSPFAQQQQQQQPQQPQATGFGASLFSTASNGASPAPAPQPQQQQQLAPQPTGFAGSSIKPFVPTSAFGSAAFGGASPAPANGQQQGQQQQQAQTGVLFS